MSDAGVMNAIVGQLRETAKRQRLVQRAIESMAAYVHAADPEEVDWAFAFEDIRAEFGSHMLCFESLPPSVEAPYLSTHLELYVRTHRVGYFERLTNVRGEEVDTQLWINGAYYRGEKAAEMLQRVLSRPDGSPEAWIGLVGLRSTSGNDFFPDWALGGYSNVVALATDEDDFRKRVTEYWHEMGVPVEEIDDVEPLRERIDRADLDDEYLELALSLSDATPVAHHPSIHCYRSDDEDDGEDDEE